MVWQFFKELSIELPYDPMILFLGIYTKELKAGTQTYTCSPMFTAALFAIGKKWKELKCSSMMNE